MLKRCDWVPLNKALYVQYHDNEWGVLVRSDEKLFEALCLEISQAGLSWYTILSKRVHYRKVFKNFDISYVSSLKDFHFQSFQTEYNIIKHRKKFEAIILNARVIRKIQNEKGSFWEYILDFLPERKPIINSWQCIEEIPQYSEISVTIVNDLKRLGMSFVGPKIIYSFLQATGFINDHLVYCFRHRQVIEVV
jgi:DNA-3-methyladenine glycosylase I